MQDLIAIGVTLVAAAWLARSLWKRFFAAPCQPPHGGPRRIQMQRHAPAQEKRGVVIAQHKVGIRHGGQFSAHAIAGGAGI